MSITAEMKVALKLHEWEYAENGREALCISCGAWHRIPKKNKLRHREGCAYKAVLDTLGISSDSDGV